MLSTVVGSLPVEKNKPSNFKDKILNIFGAYDPFKNAIQNAVFTQLDAGVDIISDGQTRGDMISQFSKYIPGMKIENNNTFIVSKIKKPINEITVKDLLFAKKLIKKYYPNNVPEAKNIKGIVTGPSTIIHSSRITSFYKNKDDAIIDLAHSLKYEINAIDKKVKPAYIQIDEPFLSTGMVNMKTARESIDILHEDLNVPLAMHVCGTIDETYKDLAKFNVEILDFEFAGNDININVLKNHFSLFKNKKIGFGCIDSSKNDLDSYESTENLISQGIKIIGEKNIILDPDCGLRRAPADIAYEKLKLMNDIKNKY